jgi:hypothetical protein
MDNVDVLVGSSSGGVVDERRRPSRLPTVLTVVAVALPFVAAIGEFMAYSGDEWSFLSGASRTGKILENFALTGAISGLLVAASSYLRRVTRSTDAAAEELPDA